MYGTLTDKGEDEDLLLTLGGSFVGPGGEAIPGLALIQEITGTSVGAQAGTGTWWVVRD